MYEVFQLRWHQLNTFQGAGKADKTWLHGWHVTVSHARRCLASRLTWWPWPSPRPEWPSLTSAAPPRVKVCVLPPGIPGSGARGHADETIPVQWGSSQFCLLCHFFVKRWAAATFKPPELISQRVLGNIVESDNFHGEASSSFVFAPWGGVGQPWWPLELVEHKLCSTKWST